MTVAVPKPAPHRNKGEQVAQLLLERIIAARLEPGSSFGTEAELLAQFNVSRPTVRESLKIARMVPDKTSEELWAINVTATTALMKSEDFREGPRAFAEKRKPNWTGH